MSAALLQARSDLRARWRSWLLLGLLTGVAFGVGAAGMAGAARRADRAVDRALAASPRLDAAVLPNDPAFDEARRASVAALPVVEAAYPFVVPWFLAFVDPAGEEGPLVPTTAESAFALEGPVVAGRHTDPSSPDEIVIDENFRDRHDVDLGSTLVLAHHVPAGAVEQLPIGDLPQGLDLDFEVPVTVVGIVKSFTTSDILVVPSAGFHREYGERIVGPTNLFATLHEGEAQFEQFRQGVRDVMGRPVNVERGSDFLRLRQLRSLTGLERDALVLFASASFVIGSVLVGQALARTVAASRDDGEVMASLGADRRMVTGAMVLPSLAVAAVAAVSTLALAVGLSDRFPLGSARQLDLDLGVHVDWLVVAPAALAAVAFVVVTSLVTARSHAGPAAPAVGRRPSQWARAASRAHWPSVLVGTRLVSDPPRGGGSVALRSTLFGLVVGVVGVVGCITFRHGIDDTLRSPERSGVAWDARLLTIGGPIDPEASAVLAASPLVDELLDARWLRSVDIDGVPTSLFGTRRLAGEPGLVVLEGRAPTAPDEIAVAPATSQELGASLGTRVAVGQDPGRTAVVVGIALLPETPHTAYDQGAWVDGASFDALLAAEPPAGPEDVADQHLIRWTPGSEAEGQRLLLAAAEADGGVFAEVAALPGSVAELRSLRVLPAALAVLFALLALATVAHALVTTVRQRRRDLSVLRSLGFTRRQTRLAVAWQASLLAALGLAIGVPLGLVGGRVAWRLLAHEYPIEYVPPAGVLAALLVVPATLLAANIVAAGPAWSASRIRPSEALRVE